MPVCASTWARSCDTTSVAVMLCVFMYDVMLQSVLFFVYTHLR